MPSVDINNQRILNRSKHQESKDVAATYADRIDMLQARASVLTGKDKALMQLYLRSGSTFNQMARLAGVNEATVARRVNKIIARLINSEYITCLRSCNKLDSHDRRIAKDYFLEGLSQRNIAKKRNISVYRVRQSLRKIQKIVRVSSGAV